MHLHMINPTMLTKNNINSFFSFFRTCLFHVTEYIGIIRLLFPKLVMIKKINVNFLKRPSSYLSSNGKSILREGEK